MKRVLNIVTSIKGEKSNSNRLSGTILQALLNKYPGSEVHTHDLNKHPFPHLEEAHLTSFNTPVENHTAENKAAIEHSNAAIQEIMNADIIVLGVPYYNFAIPSTLKAWIDHIVRAGITFTYADGTPKGLVPNKKVYLALASGGVFSDGPFKSYDFAKPYLEMILGFIGMSDITSFRIEGVLIPGVAEHAWEKAERAVKAYTF